ncbi:MAG: hypothetical protein K2X81_21420, partial [Candidatus Obscuribacterales bacterium]|nr:hypothetical protein [Candidatus Obscuribacterales bacterium]
KEIFSSLFLVGQDDSNSRHFSDRAQRITLLGQFANMSENTSSDVDKAVQVIEEKLDKFPFRGKVYRIDDLISGLSRGKSVLEERLLHLEREKDEASAHIEELKQLEEELQVGRRTQKREEYFQLCLETAELDARIMKVQQRLSYEADIKREITVLGDLADFPISAQRRVQELWTMLQARHGDRDRLDMEIMASIKEANLLKEQYSKHAAGLDQYVLEDAQQLYGLAKNLQAAQEELEQLQLDRAKEMRRVKNSGVDFDSISLTRKSILAMDPAALEEAYKLSNELKWQKEKLANLVSISEGTGRQVKVVGEEIALFNSKSRKIKATLMSLTTVALLVAAVLVVQHSPNLAMITTIFGTSFVLMLIALLALPPLLTGVRKDMEGKADALDEQRKKFDTEELDLSNLISDLQRRGDELAKENGYDSSVDLFKNVQTYSSVSGQLKQLDISEHMILSREQQIKNMSADAHSYFNRIDRKLSIVTTAAITGLASEILRHKESLRELERGNAVLNHRKSESKLMNSKILEFEAELRELFEKARLTEPSNIERSFEEFDQKALKYAKWESLSKELGRIEKDITTEILDADLSTVLYKLQHRRTGAWNTMQDLIAKYPEILSETLEDNEIGRINQGENDNLESILNQKQSRADELRSTIRSAAKNFDDFHPKTQHELEILERDLISARHTKNSLNLARICLMQVAQESKSSWSEELALIADEMLSNSNLEVRKIEWNEQMEMMISVANHDDPIHETALEKKVSRGLLKQINWITRLMLCRYICKRVPLPIVLDEPFCDLDDKRFEACMELLVRKILPHCQLIVLTCQKVRHQWLLNKLPDIDKQKIQFISA